MRFFIKKKVFGFKKFMNGCFDDELKVLRTYGHVIN